MTVLGMLKSKARLRATATELYGRVVTQSRSPVLYAELEVADTPEGRLEMVLLHMVLLQERLKAEGAAGQMLARALSETFVTDMDDCMREMGIGDLTVPRKVKKAAAALFDRSRTLGPALAGADLPRLERELAAIPGAHAGRAPRAAALAAYALAVAAALSRQPASDTLDGRVAFPPPAAGAGGRQP